MRVESSTLATARGGLASSGEGMVESTMVSAVERNPMQASAMAQDFGWQRSAEAYAQLYQKLAGIPLIQGEEEEAVKPKRVPIPA